MISRHSSLQPSKHSSACSAVDLSVLDDDIQTLKSTAEQALEWLELNDRDKTAKDYMVKQKEIEDIAKPIIAKMYGNDSSMPYIPRDEKDNFQASENGDVDGPP